MSDDLLLALGRAAREVPDNVEAGLAYANALARTGQRRRAFLEYSRLAREAGGEALDTVESWTPWPAVSGLRASRLVRRRAAVRWPPTIVTALLSLSGVDRVAGATDATVFLQSPETLVAVGLDDRQIRWREAIGAGRAPEQRVTILGDAVLVLHDRELVLHTETDGSVLARAPLPGLGRHLIGLGDRALVVVEDGSTGLATELVCVDVGERFGHVLWTENVPRLSLAGLAGSFTLRDGGWFIRRRNDPPYERCSLASGAMLDYERSPEGAVYCFADESWSVMTSDHEGLVFGSGARFLERSVVSVRWQNRAEPGAAAIPVRNVVALSVHSPFDGIAMRRGVSVVERDGGRTIWTRAFNADAEHMTIAVAGKTLYAAFRRPGHVEVRGHELEDGRTRFEVILELDRSEGVSFLELVPLEKSLAVFVGRSNGVSLALLREP